MRAILLLLGGCAQDEVPDAFAYRRGVHVTHWLGRLMPDYLGHSRTPHTYAAPWFDEQDLDWIAEHGFDHVQIHADAEQWFSPEGALLEPKLAPFDAILEAAGKRGLGVVLLLEGGDLAGWPKIAARFSEVGDGLRLRVEEPEALPAIRAVSPERFVYVPIPVRPGGEQDELANLGEPERWDDRVGLSFSYYRPEVFALQLPGQPVRLTWPGTVPAFGDLSAAGWAEWYLPFVRAAVPGTPLGPELLDAQFAALGAWSAANAPGRELYLAEFGLFEGGDAESARRYLGDLVRAAERHGVGWSVYDYESGRAIRGHDGAPTPLYEGLGLKR